jgi:thioredoxin 1
MNDNEEVKPSIKISTGFRIGIVAALVVVVAVVIFTKNIRSGQAGSSTASAKALPSLVDLGANKCIPCRMMAPILEKLREDYAQKMNVTVIDVFQNPAAGKQYDVTIIPTQIFFDSSGKELYRHEGFFSREEILAKWQELGVRLN